MVEYTTDVEILGRPTGASGNRVLLFEGPNRGNKLALGAFNAGVPPGAAERNALKRAGDGHLMREGYTLVWFGWQADVLPGQQPPHPERAGRAQCRRLADHRDGARRARDPQRHHDAQPVERLVHARSTTQLSDGRARQPHAVRRRLPAALTVRAREQHPRVPIPNTDWSFGACPDGGAVTPATRRSAIRRASSPAGSTS